MRAACHDAPHYAVFEILLLVPPLYAQATSAAPNSQTLTAYAFLLT